MGLFNIMQEGDVQIKGYPVGRRWTCRRSSPLIRRLHGARKNHHAAEVPHRLPNPDALSGDAGRGNVHYRTGIVDSARRQTVGGSADVRAEIVEEVAFQAREDKRITGDRVRPSACQTACRECTKQCGTTTARSHDSAVVARVADVYAAIPAMTENSSCK